MLKSQSIGVSIKARVETFLNEKSRAFYSLRGCNLTPIMIHKPHLQRKKQILLLARIDFTHLLYTFPINAAD